MSMTDETVRASRPGMCLAHRFDVLAPAGSGGVGTVYRGRDRLSGDDVAVKFLRHRDVSDVERFHREAGVLAQLSHPCIVRYIDHGETPDGSLYLVMEWIQGETLSARLVRGPLSIEETLALGLHLSQALASAHA